MTRDLGKWECQNDEGFGKMTRNVCVSRFNVVPLHRMKQENEVKDVVQSYLITTARYKFSVMEKRIMYRIIESGQDLIEGRKLHGHITVQPNLLNDREVTMSYTDILENSNNINTVRKALLDLTKKMVVWGNTKVGGAYTLIERPKWDDTRGLFSFRVPQPIWDAMMMQFEKGFRKYQLETAMGFSSVYSMRLYELISRQQYPLTYFVDDLKGMLGVDGKYPRLYDFKKWVLNVAKEELDANADYSFDYTVKGQSITFVPYRISRGDEAERKSLVRQISVSRLLPPNLMNYLVSKGFNKREIKAHYELFRKADEVFGDSLLPILAEMSAKSRTKENPKGWIINALRGKINDQR